MTPSAPQTAMTAADLTMRGPSDQERLSPFIAGNDIVALRIQPRVPLRPGYFSGPSEAAGLRFVEDVAQGEP